MDGLEDGALKRGTEAAIFPRTFLEISLIAIASALQFSEHTRNLTFACGNRMGAGRYECEMCLRSRNPSTGCDMPRE